MSTTKTSSKLYDKTSVVFEDPDSGELYIYLPEDMLLHLGWDEGTELEWIEDANGVWSLQKVKETETKK
jgi:hypothetical protein